MKLAKKLSIAAATAALSFAAVSAKPAEAASVNFLNQTGGGSQYNYNVLANLGSSEQLQANSTITLQGLSGVTGVTNLGSNLSLFGFDTNSVFLKVVNTTAFTSVGTAFANLGFTVNSTVLTPGQATFSVLNSPTFNSGTTVGAVAVPEPFTMGGSAVAIGMGLWMKRKKAAASQKA